MFDADRLTLRERELDALAAALAEDIAQLVVVAGGAGTGKTTLLRAAGARAIECGWATARGEPPRDLAVGPATTPADFAARLEELLAVGVTPGGTDFGPRRAARDADPTARAVAACHSRGRTCVFVDGFRASDRFLAWFGDSFVESLRRSTPPVVVVVADRNALVVSLAPWTNRRIEVGPVDAEQIRAYFEALGRFVQPPLGDNELVSYVDAVVDRPALLSSLTRLLALAQPPAQSR